MPREDVHRSRGRVGQEHCLPNVRFGSGDAHQLDLLAGYTGSAHTKAVTVKCASVIDPGNPVVHFLLVGDTEKELPTVLDNEAEGVRILWHTVNYSDGNDYVWGTHLLVR